MGNAERARARAFTNKAKAAIRNIEKGYVYDLDIVEIKKPEPKAEPKAEAPKAEEPKAEDKPKSRGRKAKEEK